METIDLDKVVSLPSTSAHICDEGIVNGITEIGSLFIKSIRSDYNDAPEYKSWSSGYVMTRLEYREVVVNKQQGINLNLDGYITKIELVNLPVCVYTLCINGINVMSSKNMIFDLEHCYTDSINFFMKPLEDEIDMNNILHEAPKTQQRYLDICKYDVKICCNNNYKSLIPEEIILNVHRINNRKTLHTIYYNTNILELSSPTEYISIVLDSYNSDSRIKFYINTMCIADITNITQNRFVIKFGKTYFSELNNNDRENGDFFSGYDKRVGISGMEDHYLDGHNVETLNFSRMGKKMLVTYNCKLKSVNDVHYMSYYFPYKNCQIDSINKIYNM